MARLCDELAAVLMAGEPPHDSLGPALFHSLPGANCLSVALAAAGGQLLRVQPLIEAGSLRRGSVGCFSLSAADSDSAAWHSFSAGKILKGKDGICSTSKTKFADWSLANQRYGSTSFVTAPLEVGAGIMGTLTAAGGAKMDTRSVLALAGRLAEVLLRRTLEKLLKAASEELQGGGGTDAAARIAALYPQVVTRSDGSPFLDLRITGGDDSDSSIGLRTPSFDISSGSTGRKSTDSQRSAAGGATGLLPGVRISPFASFAAAAASQVGMSPRSDLSMRASSFEQYQELKYYCLTCRAENCVDLPQWHWGQLVDHLCTGRRQRSGGLSTNTAPVPTTGLDVSSPSPRGASATGAARMARLAAMCARDYDDGDVLTPLSSERASTRVSSTADLTHPAAQRAASGQLRRISPGDIDASPASSRAPSVSDNLRTSSGSSPHSPSPPGSSRKPPVAPSSDNPLRTQSADRASPRNAVLAYTAGLRRRSATHGPSAEGIAAAAAAARAARAGTGPSALTAAPAAGADADPGIRAVTSYVEELRRKSQDFSRAREPPDGVNKERERPDGLRMVSNYVDNLRSSSQVLAKKTSQLRRGNSPPDVPQAAAAPDASLSAASLKAASVYEDETARDAVNAYRAMRAASSAPRTGGRAAASPQQPLPKPEAGDEAFATRASTTRTVADKSKEGVEAARSAVDDYMASMKTRSQQAASAATAAAAQQGRTASPSPSPPAPPLAQAPATDAAQGSPYGKAVVDDYLANLRSRSMAALVARSGSPTPPPASSAAASGAATSSPAGGSSSAATGGSSGVPTPADARVTVDNYMNSLRQQSARVAQARSAAIVSGTTRSGSGGSRALPELQTEASNDSAAMVANYMRSLRRQSVAAAATAAARQSSASHAGSTNTAAEAATSSSASAAATSPTTSWSPLEVPQQQDSDSMTEARKAVAAHMEALRERSRGSSSRPSSAADSATTGAGSTDASTATAVEPDSSSVPLTPKSPAASARIAAIAARAASAEEAASSAGPPADNMAAPSAPALHRAQTPQADPATAVISTYMQSLRRTSAALGGSAARQGSLRAPSMHAPAPRQSHNVGSLRAGSVTYDAAAAGPQNMAASIAVLDPQAITHDPSQQSSQGLGGLPPMAPLRGGSNPDSDSGSGRDGQNKNVGSSQDAARDAVASYLEGLRERSRAEVVAPQPAGVSVRSSGSLRGGSLRLNSIPLEPVGEAEQQGKDGFKQHEGLDGFSEQLDPDEAAAEKSEHEAHKVVATYIESLRRASTQPYAKPKSIRVDFGASTGSGPMVQLSTSSASTNVSGSSSVMYRDSGASSGATPTAASAVTAYLAALQRRAAENAAAAAQPGAMRSGSGNIVRGGRAQANSAPDAQAAIGAYMEGLKSRSAQAALMRRMSSTSTQGLRSPSIATSSIRSPSNYPGSSLRLDSSTLRLSVPSQDPSGFPAAASGFPVASSSALASPAGPEMLPPQDSLGTRLGSGGGGALDDAAWYRRPVGLETLDEDPSSAEASCGDHTSGEISSSEAAELHRTLHARDGHTQEAGTAAPAAAAHTASAAASFLREATADSTSATERGCPPIAATHAMGPAASREAAQEAAAEDGQQDGSDLAAAIGKLAMADAAPTAVAGQPAIVAAAAADPAAQAAALDAAPA